MDSARVIRDSLHAILSVGLSGNSVKNCDYLCHSFTSNSARQAASLWLDPVALAKPKRVAPSRLKSAGPWTRWKTHPGQPDA